MSRVLKYAGQAVVFGCVAVFTAYFASHPTVQQIPDGMAQIKLSFAHGSDRKIDCRKLTSKEIAALPANERRPNNCTRERIPVRIQLSVDGEIIYDDELQPAGLSRDGAAMTYRKFTVPAGPHILVARLRDSKRPEGFDYEATHQVTLEPWQNLAVDFKADTGGFSFR